MTPRDVIGPLPAFSFDVDESVQPRVASVRRLGATRVARCGDGAHRRRARR